MLKKSIHLFKYQAALLKINRFYFSEAPEFDEIVEAPKLTPKFYTKTNYFRDPEEISEKIAAVLLNHHNINNNEVKLSDTFHSLGLNLFDKQDVLNHLQYCFDVNISYDEREKMNTVHDMV